MLYLITTIIVMVMLVWISISTVYLLFFAIAGHISHPHKPGVQDRLRRILVLIPAYKEDEVIVDTARRAMMQDYPEDLFSVVVIADSLMDETIERLRLTGSTLIKVSFEKSTKARALRKALESIVDTYDIVVVLDADNVMETTALRKINRGFSSGYLALQCHRVSKNLNTPLAILDSISEEINNHVFRQGHVNVNLSSALIGSGMAFDFNLFKTYINKIDAIGGFDKELEINLIKDGIRISYMPDCLVQDEKVQDARTFSNQRRRWISAQVRYFRTYAPSALKDMMKYGRADYFDKVFQMGLPPRILHLGISCLFFLFSFVMSVITVQLPIMSIITFAWAINFILTGVALIISVPGKYYNMASLKSLSHLPAGFFYMFLSALRIKGANREFIHTKHKII